LMPGCSSNKQYTDIFTWVGREENAFGASKYVAMLTGCSSNITMRFVVGEQASGNSPFLASCSTCGLRYRQPDFAADH
jgi:hypothetical protein